jgi:hypothetical protein
VDSLAGPALACRMAEHREPDLRGLQLFAVLLDYVALAVLAIVPDHAYAWMGQGGAAPAPDDPVRDVRLLLTGAAVLVAGALNLYLALSRRGLWRVGNGALLLALAGFWTVKFLV